MAKIWVLVSVLSLSLIFGGCGAGSGSGLDGVPAVAPIVDSAAPTALKAGTSSSFVLDLLSPHGFDQLKHYLAKIFGISSAYATPPSDTTIKAQLESIFKGTYSKISGGSGTGYMNALLEDLDSRMNELKTRFSGKSLKCMSNDSKSFTIDLSSINAAFKLTLDVQCKDVFGGAAAGDVSADGSGMVFGKNSAGDYSLWLLLNHSSTSGFGYAAKVTHPSETDKSVDLIFVEGEDQYSRGTIARLKAQPSTKKYELVYRSTSPNGISPISGGSGNVALGYAVDIISDGTLIYVQGVYWTAGQTCSQANSAGIFTSCLDATDLSTASASCTTLANSFTIATASNLTAMNCPTIPIPSSSEKTLFNSIQISNADGSTSSDRD